MDHTKSGGNRGNGKRTHQVQWSDCVGYGYFNVLTPMGLVLSGGLVSLGLAAPTSEPLLIVLWVAGREPGTGCSDSEAAARGGAVETGCGGKTERGNGEPAVEEGKPGR